jgi:hypothetical protein
MPAARLPQTLAGRETWRPYPTAADRARWEALPGKVRRRLIGAGEAELRTPWPVLPATAFLEFKRTGNRSHYEGLNFARRNKLRTLVMAECAEGRGRFTGEALNGLWATLEETWWGLPAHLGAQKPGPGLPDVSEPVVDLFAAETGSLLAWSLYLLGPAFDQLSPLVRRRVHAELDRQLLIPALERDDFGWMGLRGQHALNNWTPWICSNWLTCILLAERHEEKRRAAVAKIVRVLDNFLNGYDDDGGCDEGPGYWNAAGGALFDNLELLHSATGGAFDVYGNPLVREIGRYIYRAHIAGDYYTNFADASAVVEIDGCMVWRYGRRIGDARMAALGAWAARRHDAITSGFIGRQLPRVFAQAEMSAAPAREALARDVWLPGIQVMAARVREGSSRGLYLAAQGGHNAESHNHNDVGNFMVYADGQPVIIDVGVETYSAKTFSAKRYEIWTMQPAYHNLPSIDGVMQAAGRQYAARNVQYRADGAGAEFSLDIAAAYPAAAKLKEWRRTFYFDRAHNRISVRDRYTAARAPRVVVSTLMTGRPMTQPAAGTVALGDVRVSFDPKVFTVAQEAIPIADARLRSVWGDRLYRVLLTAQHPGERAEWSLEISQA